ncbi:DEAD/DEAH box helicase [Virgibacillus siamensis]|uniref:DEAD/DEAH box helicase n=1 Tax=Virgibacillus siamensis TaxID=480071 RepID=UPI000985D196|nr:helicase-related protein [Virgibacillus siamensis]
MQLQLEHDFISRYDGKLLLRREIPINKTAFEQLLQSSYFTSVPSFERKLYQLECQRCGNRKTSLLGKMPCLRCEKTHGYCRKCIQMGRVIECEPLYEWSGPKAVWPEHPDACSWKGKLTSVQQHAAERITAAIKHNETELLVWAVCGAGKTEMLFPGITETLRMGKRICIATPRTDVVRELLPRMRDGFSSVYIQGMYGESRERDGTAQMIIATTHQLLRFKHAFDVIVIDEIDAFPYHSDPSLAFAAERARKANSTTIYLTATPRRNHRHRIAMKKLPHIFVPSRFHGYPLPVPVLRMSFSLRKALKQYHPPKVFKDWIQKRTNPNRQLLIFVPTINLANHLIPNLKAIRLDNITAVHASDKDREEKIEKFRNRHIQTLVTTTILERGVTFPSVDVAVLDAGHTVFDEAALVQIAGRAGRSPDDPTGEVVFFHDGKTNAMAEAVQSIKKMNKRGGFS